ncbi:glucose/mannose-6-phosphate isomerase [Motilibacter peucedani]|uniref:Glucose/mannose-6-phosphate isomerase n=1 Tax=Motilibacter peucedani TaxID=598650 RepID=A0A420XLZ1_9ACTN|nr:SIS domain-containing protein [Motilibacter peucedani]RKS71419.1 glucose/mannose-6-phosphate isomerase [Motilibacter peucedani]
MTGSLQPDDALLDSPSGIEAADPGEVLRACATAGAQVRSAARATAEAGAGRVAADGRPRAVVVAGAGAAGLAGTVLEAVAGPVGAVPVVCVHHLTLPGWVGPLDLVLAVSASGRTEETLAVAEEAARRGVRLVTVTASGSPLHALGEQARALHVPVQRAGRSARASLWSLAVPLLVVADALGLAAVPASDLSGTADVLDRLAADCAPSVEVGLNPAKDLALALAGTLPVVWGTSPVASAAGARLVAQLAAAAKLPALLGELPDVVHSGAAVLDGPLTSDDGDDIFRDPFDSPPGLRLRVVLVRDAVEHPRVAARAVALGTVAERRGVPLTVLRGEGESALQRLAALVGLADFATTYLALATGVNPAADLALDEVAGRTREAGS